ARVQSSRVRFLADEIMCCFTTDRKRNGRSFQIPTAMPQSPEPSAFPPLDCANNAPFAPMRRHCGGAVYVHPPLGTGGCNAHATYFGRDSWGWGVRGSAIDACAGVR